MSSITVYRSSNSQASHSSDLDTYVTHCYDLMAKEKEELSPMEAEELCVCSQFNH